MLTSKTAGSANAILALVALFVVPPSLAAGAEDPALTQLVAEVRAGASVTYTDLLTVGTPSELVIRALQHPLLMAELWQSYGYTPEYGVNALDGTDHFSALDPTGLQGELWLARQTANRVIYVGSGEIDHWAAPALNGGRIVIEIFVAPGTETSRVGIQIYLDPRSGVASLVAKSFAATARELLERRVRANFADASNILEQIHADPQAVAERLEGSAKARFLDLFPASGP